MKILFPSRLSLVICILMGAIQAQLTSADGPDKLSPCPDSPNCVSSQSTDEAHLIEPLHYSGRPADARQKLIDILESINRVRFAKVERDYIHAEFRSSVFRFVDDVKFWFPPDKPIIHVKSASRKGYYDFGANRRRVERLREALKK
jgi:uncharacterized protein (DUF1499 family)